MAPLAPPRLSTITDCFRDSASFGVTSRAVISEAPPAGNGTITVMLRSGYCAAAGITDRAAKTKPASAEILEAFIEVSGTKSEVVRKRGECLARIHSARNVIMHDDDCG